MSVTSEDGKVKTTALAIGEKETALNGLLTLLAEGDPYVFLVVTATQDENLGLLMSVKVQTDIDNADVLEYVFETASANLRAVIS